MQTIYISRTYAVISPESAEHGDWEESGFLAEREEVTLRELADLLRGGNPSQFPSRGGVNEWVSIEGDYDPHTGSETLTMVHYCREQSNPNAPTIWRRAFKLAGIAR